MKFNGVGRSKYAAENQLHAFAALSVQFHSNFAPGLLRFADKSLRRRVTMRRLVATAVCPSGA